MVSVYSYKNVGITEQNDELLTRMLLSVFFEFDPDSV